MICLSTIDPFFTFQLASDLDFQFFEILEFYWKRYGNLKSLVPPLYSNLTVEETGYTEVHAKPFTRYLNFQFYLFIYDLFRLTITGRSWTDSRFWKAYLLGGLFCCRYCIFFAQFWTISSSFLGGCRTDAISRQPKAISRLRTAEEDLLRIHQAATNIFTFLHIRLHYRYFSHDWW